ncbi:MAG TPA: efflux RND transporter periplasmic adaptor subunit [Terracidiphilus sp.]|jgi:HlyD family secretion protein|nr:efflux RND transporter periplasmic adaptor subunit [Terracidiphilus sp.]
MAKERRQLNWGWVWLGAAVILVLVFVAVRSLTRERLDVRVAQVTRQSLESTESTNGRVEPEMNMQITSPLATTVKAVYVQAGDKVSAGKVLMQLDDIDARAKLASADSGVKTAQAILEAATHNGTQEQQQASAAEVTRARMDRDQAQHDLDALTKLNAAGAASGSEVAAARQRLAGANAALTAAETSGKNRYSPAEVARAEAGLSDAQANLAVARDIERRTTVRAPIAGTVYSVGARATDFAVQGKVLLQIADLKHELVRAYFDEPDIGVLAVGQPVVIKWDARLGEIWHGHIERVPVTVTQYGTRYVGEVPIAVDDNYDGKLLPDTNVTVTVTTSTQSNAVTIPKEALHVENGKPFVFRVEGDELKRTPVNYGNMNINQVAILSGLKEGDWVATGTLSGQPLQEGVPIKEVR